MIIAHHQEKVAPLINANTESIQRNVESIKMVNDKCDEMAANYQILATGLAEITETTKTSNDKLNLLLNGMSTLLHSQAS